MDPASGKPYATPNSNQADRSRRMDALISEASCLSSSVTNPSAFGTTFAQGLTLIYWPLLVFIPQYNFIDNGRVRALEMLSSAITRKSWDARSSAYTAAKHMQENQVACKKSSCPEFTGLISLDGFAPTL